MRMLQVLPRVGKCAIAGIVLLQLIAPVPAPAQEQKLRIGVYDPQGDFKNVSGIAIEHIYGPWEDVDIESLDDADQYARERKRELLLTVEPWSWGEQRRKKPVELKDGILSGHYDAVIRTLCTKVSRLKSPITIRWGHEMDLPNGRYPWADWAPEDYVAAYRRFVDQCRMKAPKAKFMWSPRGERNLESYYPGDRYVDVIGLSIFGLQAYDKESHGSERTFRDLLAPSYELAAKFNKPISIAEFGCSGDAAYLKGCNDLSAATLRLFPRLTSVIYYSQIDTGPWPTNYGRPDWRVTPERLALPRPR